MSVRIDSIIQRSPSNYQARGTEEARGPNGEFAGTPAHWEAMLQAEIVPPQSDDTIINNPLGFHVTRLTSTEQRGYADTTELKGRSR